MSEEEKLVKIELSHFADQPVITSLSHELETKIDSHGESIKEIRNDIDDNKTEIEALKAENYNLKNFISTLEKVKVNVPYEEGYLRAIGATRSVTLKELIQQ